MPFKPGKPKTGGKKKGQPNHKTKEKKDRVEWVLGLLEETLEQDVKKLTPAERARYHATMLEYAVPKLARTEHTGRIVTENYDVNLTKEEMKQISQTLENDC
jgi:hypothetical protein